MAKWVSLRNTGVPTIKDVDGKEKTVIEACEEAKGEAVKILREGNYETLNLFNIKEMKKKMGVEDINISWS